MFDFQGSSMFLVDLFDKHSPFHLIVVQLEANRCVLNVKIWIVVCYALALTWLSHTWIEGLETTSLIKWDTTPYLATRWDTYITDTNKTAKDDKDQWLDKEDKRQNMTDREITKWKVNPKDSKLTNEKQARAYDLIEHNKGFNFHDKIWPCPQVKVQVPYFVNP